jgi:transcriptional regulator with XRE-family HTH domain
MVVGTDDATTAVADLAEYLQGLKNRSGRTFEGLARRSGLSRSSVHRYCRGLIVPDGFAPLEALARACGAERAELVEVHRRWTVAVGSRREHPDSAGAPPERWLADKAG